MEEDMNRKEKELWLTSNKKWKIYWNKINQNPKEFFNFKT